MLKLKGHPPMLLRRQDNEDPIKHFSKTFFKVKHYKEIEMIIMYISQGGRYLC